MQINTRILCEENISSFRIFLSFVVITINSDMLQTAEVIATDSWGQSGHLFTTALCILATT